MREIYVNHQIGSIWVAAKNCRVCSTITASAGGLCHVCEAIGDGAILAAMDRETRR
jgi:hypothetical protein